MSQLQDRIVKLLEGNKQGLSRRELSKKLRLGKGRLRELASALDVLLGGSRIARKGGSYLLTEGRGLIPAEIVKVNRTFGFAAPKSGGSDYFIPGRKLAGAMPGDAVLLRPLHSSGELPEAEVVSVTNAVSAIFSGSVVRDELGGLAVLPDRYVRFPLRIGEGIDKRIKPGDKISAELSFRGDRHFAHEVRVLEVFGDGGNAANCARAILAENGIPLLFSAEALEQARGLAAGEGIHPKELAARLDLREQEIFTIDGADTKDIDDAVSLTARESGWTLGVHIADVSYYVTPKSPLDEEAYLRGTSVYYADQVVPMLPPELSNGLCSLNPGEDRLALSVFIELDQNARLREFSFQKTVIRSRLQGVYHEMNRLFGGGAEPSLRQKYGRLEPTLLEMRRLAALLAQNRAARGAVELNTVESSILVGEDGLTAGVGPRARGDAERMIEEFMLTANEAAAAFAMKAGLPFLYRVHEPPSPEKLANWYDTLERLGVPVKRARKGVSAKAVSAVLDTVRGTPLDAVVNYLTLRVMSKAKYTPENTGHFGLALDHYAQFTSPIRRYPDLAIHRVLSACLTGMRRDNIEKRFRSWVPGCALQSTGREIAAMTAERDCEDCYRAEFLARHIGESFAGEISGVTAFGLFVRLPNTCEGFVAAADFPPGDWSFDGSIAYSGRSGEQLMLGGALRVRIAAADVSSGKVTFTADSRDLGGDTLSVPPEQGDARIGKDEYHG